MQSIDIERFGEAPALLPMTYPGARPKTSFFYTEGRVLTLESDDPAGEARDWLHARDQAPLRSRIAVLCLGSNACPPQIHRKVGDRETGTILFLRVRVRGVRPVYAGHVARYGAIPATGDRALEPQSLFLALYTPEQLKSTARSEGDSYDLSRLEDAEVTAGASFRVDRPYAFLARRGTLRLFAESGPVPLEDLGQEPLIRSLLKQTHLERTLSFESYASDPARYRQELESAIEEHGLRRPHRLRHRPIALDQARPIPT